MECETYCIVRSPVIDTLKFDACAATHGGERHDVTAGGDPHSTEERISRCITQVSISTGTLHRQTERQ